MLFDGSGDREMPLIIGLMPVLPRHLIDPDSFGAAIRRTALLAAASMARRRSGA